MLCDIKVVPAYQGPAVYLSYPILVLFRFAPMFSSNVAFLPRCHIDFPEKCAQYPQIRTQKSCLTDLSSLTFVLDFYCMATQTPRNPRAPK